MGKSKYYNEYYIKPHCISQKENLEKKALDLPLSMERQD